MRLLRPIVLQLAAHKGGMSKSPGCVFVGRVEFLRQRSHWGMHRAIVCAPMSHLQIVGTDVDVISVGSRLTGESHDHRVSRRAVLGEDTLPSGHPPQRLTHLAVAIAIEDDY